VGQRNQKTITVLSLERETRRRGCSDSVVPMGLREKTVGREGEVGEGWC
jgi:hypothetical protein